MSNDFPIEEGIENDPITAPDDLLKAGIDIYYADDRYPDPNLLVMESPDGSKKLVTLKGEEIVVLKTL